MFTGSWPWELVNRADVARGERALKKNLAGFESWYRHAKDSDELKEIIAGIQSRNK